jgi:beta-lactamase regulating signal transducer with metallopeptidase domain
MMQLADWLSPATLRLLALALLHFLWQGAALAALAYVVMGLCRSASARYAVGVATLVLMFVAPIGTFFILRAQSQDTPQIASADTRGNFAVPASAAILSRAKHTTQSPENAPAYFLWLVEAWFAGVVLLSLRSAGGILLVERLRRKESTPVSEELLQMCLSLQRRMGLTRILRYCESIRLDAPAVAGWFRPVVLLPMAAVTGLSEEQLEAVIAHELAHIRRHDAFVQLFQVGVETLLFYHPAVWWIGKRIRTERENCCDDVAVALCGSPVTYAKALTRMAESKAAPQLVMAINRSPLIDRISRLLGANRGVQSFRSANLFAGVLCLVTALLAGSAFLGNVHRVQAQTPVAAPAAQPASEPAAAPAPAARKSRVPDTAFTIRPSTEVSDESPTPAPAPAPKAPEADDPSQVPAPAPQASPSSPRQSYIDSLKDAGLTNLSVDQLIGLKVQGVTGEYVKEMKDLGLKVDVDNLIGMKVQGISPEYVKGMRDATGQSLDTDALIGMKVQGVTPDYVRQMHELGLKTDSDDIIGMKVQGVTPDYIRQMRELGLKSDADDIIGMKVQGITPDYVREMRGLGLKADSGDIIGMKVQGITPDYVKSIRDLGFHPDTSELIGMKVQGVTAGYIKELQGAGFKVDIDDAIGAKVQGITPEFIASARSHGFTNLTLEKLIQLKHAGVLDSEK